MPRVKPTEDNLRHCRCPQCPVQAKSECTKANLEKGELKTGTSGKLYCSFGKSECTDLNGKEFCLCPTCLVWDENNLRSTYYCLNGSADENK